MNGGWNDSYHGYHCDERGHCCADDCRCGDRGYSDGRADDCDHHGNSHGDQHCGGDVVAAVLE